jgi:hypothetical protein
LEVRGCSPAASGLEALEVQGVDLLDEVIPRCGAVTEEDYLTSFTVEDRFEAVCVYLLGDLVVLPQEDLDHCGLDSVEVGLGGFGLEAVLEPLHVDRVAKQMVRDSFILSELLGGPSDGAGVITPFEASHCTRVAHPGIFRRSRIGSLGLLSVASALASASVLTYRSSVFPFTSGIREKVLWRAVAGVGVFGLALAAGLSSSIGLQAPGLAPSNGLRPLLPPPLPISYPVPIPDDFGAECHCFVEVLHPWEFRIGFKVSWDFDSGLALPPYPLRVTHGASSPLDDASVGPVEDVSVLLELLKKLVPILHHVGVLIQLSRGRNSSVRRNGGSFDLPGATRRRGAL